MRRPTRTVQLVLAAALLSAGVSAFATDIQQDTGGACVPDSERAGREFGCFILAAQPFGKLDHATAGTLHEGAMTSSVRMYSREVFE